VAEVDWRT